MPRSRSDPCPNSTGNDLSVNTACSSAYGECYLNIEAGFLKSGVSLDWSLHFFAFSCQNTDSPFSMILSTSRYIMPDPTLSNFEIRIGFRKRLGLLSISHTRMWLCKPVSAHSRFAIHNSIRKFGFDVNSSSGKFVGLLLHIEHDSRGSPIYARSLPTLLTDKVVPVRNRILAATSRLQWSSNLKIYSKTLSMPTNPEMSWPPVTSLEAGS